MPRSAPHRPAFTVVRFGQTPNTGAYIGGVRYLICGRNVPRRPEFTYMAPGGILIVPGHLQYVMGTGVDSYTWHGTA